MSLLKETLFLLNFLHQYFFNGPTKYLWLSFPNQISGRRSREITHQSETAKKTVLLQLGGYFIEHIFSSAFINLESQLPGTILCLCSLAHKY